MNVLVMGGGIIGISTAWYLAKAGCSVTVIERQPGIALETSFANCGEISHSCAAPWAAPGLPHRVVLGWLLGIDTPLRIIPDWSLFQWSWLKQMLANCNQKNFLLNKKRMTALAEYSYNQFISLRKEIDIYYEERQLGTLQLFRNKRQFNILKREISSSNTLNTNCQILAPQEFATFEPALAKNQHLFNGGIHFPNDETGDCYIFAQRIMDECKKLGVCFITGKSITKICKKNNKIIAVEYGHESIHADHYIIALGSFSRHFLLDLGIKIPVYPVKGYSLTIPLINDALAPKSTILDISYKVAITRFDKRIRVGGIAELSGYNSKLDYKCRDILEGVVNELFPGSGDLNNETFWTGLRPMTPDGTPIIGPTSIKNLSINTGHGSLGWTMSLGSGKYLSDQILGIATELKIDGLSIDRYK
jgi:D-amino-acid dehydrogenase